MSERDFSFRFIQDDKETKESRWWAGIFFGRYECLRKGSTNEEYISVKDFHPSLRAVNILSSWRQLR